MNIKILEIAIGRTGVRMQGHSHTGANNIKNEFSNIKLIGVSIIIQIW